MLNTRTESVSQLNGRVISVMGSSFMTSTNTSNAAVAMPPRSIGTCTRRSKSTPVAPSPRAASSMRGVMRSKALPSGP